MPERLRGRPGDPSALVWMRATALRSPKDGGHARPGHRPSRSETGQYHAAKQGVKLLDFGLAKLGSTSPVSSGSMPSIEQATVAALTGAHTVVGTPQYMAPEQIEGKEADTRTDIFAFGCVLYELLAGQRAFDGKSASGVMASGTGDNAAADIRSRAAHAARTRANRVALPGKGSRRSLADRARCQCGAAMGRPGRVAGRSAGHRDVQAARTRGNCVGRLRSRRTDGGRLCGGVDEAWSRAAGDGALRAPDTGGPDQSDDAGSVTGWTERRICGRRQGWQVADFDPSARLARSAPDCRRRQRHPPVLGA